jgi:hypothetical protein
LASSTKLLPSPDEQWFKRQPVGIHKLGNMMRRMVKYSGIQTEKRLSNHSARKYLIQKLNYNIPKNFPVAKTLHPQINEN